MVDINITLEKMKLHKFDKGTIEWMGFYLFHQMQCIKINGQLSTMRPVNIGVPQGSILRPLIYTIFTNELLADLWHNCNHCRNNSNVDIIHLIELVCKECGNMVNYADDTSHCVCVESGTSLSGQIQKTVKTLADFLTSNKLKINQGKNHLVKVWTHQWKTMYPDPEMSIDIGQEKPLNNTNSEKLLGCYVNSHLSWNAQIRGTVTGIIGKMNSEDVGYL